MTLEHPLLPPNTNSLCSPWLPKNGMHSIYYRLFPLGASSNSLRNLLECSAPVALTLCNNNLERSYIHFTTTNIYFIGAVYNSTFLIIYKPSSLIISSQTFSMQLGAGTSLFCLSQYAIPFCTLSADLLRVKRLGPGGCLE